MKAISWSYTNCYLQVDWKGKNDITMNLTLRSIDGIDQISKRTGYALSQAGIESILFTSSPFYDL